MRCCCGSSIRHRPKYGREREKSLPVGGACGQRSRPLAMAARSWKSHTENFSPCGDATGREEMAGRLGLFEDAVFFASCAMGFAGGKTFCVVIDAGRRYVWLWCFSREYPHICNAGALQVVCTLILPDGTVESVVAFFWSAVVWQMWAGTGAGWTSWEQGRCAYHANFEKHAGCSASGP